MKKNIYSTLLFSVIGVSFNALAADGEIIVTSDFFVATCNLHTDSKNMSVPLNNIQLSKLKTAGDTSESVAFNLKFTDCAVGTFAYLIFEGTAAGNDNKVFALDDNGQNFNASSVGLEINDWQGKAITVGGSDFNRLTTGLALVGKETIFPFSARYKALDNNVKPGLANVTVQYSVTYR
ncbi:hypothetical protein Z042_10610 [Chania multitudinisentens RB-25]|uniref:Fimbrial-type adhesion domain-containing protein n=1 Tax=Chania multitudinisentens RB-25 TaxID=1441930 RepID=W0LG73_9GAMM|nr:fimbrial protein [Chania multitudinisentens]AHG22746.1 hypothetical protein Z042_10610 [Chania multitudinisentens RB-25]